MEQTHSNLSLETIDSSGETQAQTDSFSTLDYVRELYLHAEQQTRSEQKKLRLLRTAVAFLGVTMGVVILSAVLVVPALLNTANEASKAFTIVQQIDVETIASDMDALAVQASDTFSQVGDAVKVLDDLDIETLNTTIGKLETAVDSFSKLDMETLNKAISNLNATVEPLARLFGNK